MTTTIHTIEDLIRILDDNPEWMDALRARLLTRELIELPERFNQFVAEMNSFVAEVQKFVEATNRRFDALENRVASIQDDVGILKGAHARSAALRETPFIASEMGFRWVKDLTAFDLWDLIDDADTSGIPTNELRSFRRADLIIEATDQDGNPCYIAVEISFTANGRDTSRALRNAEFLTRFTGKQAFSAVVGLRRDDRIQGLVESGEVFWYQLDPEVLEAE
ncbi:MAG: hypothetical protein J4F29_04540 [Candidatus Latescibacteria bacterium]|nr:hypothetical protein [Candidatus Latescibacterota bacterium]